MRNVLCVIILILGLLTLGSGCIQSEVPAKNLESTHFLYETPEAMPDYYTQYRYNDSLEHFVEYFLTSPNKDRQIQMNGEKDRRLKEHQRYLDYLTTTPDGSFTAYLPLRYPGEYERYLQFQPKVTFAEYLLRHNMEYGYQILGTRDENRLHLSPVSEEEYSLYPDAHSFREEELLEIPVLYEIFFCNLTNDGLPIRIFEPELEVLQPYNIYGGYPFVWNGSYYYTKFSVV